MALTESDEQRRFTDLYRREIASVTAFVRRRCAADLVSSVVAETFTTAWRRLEDAERGGRPWLFRTARLTLSNAVRTETRQARTIQHVAARTDPLHGGAPAPDDLAALADVRAVLATLPERDREVLMLAYWEDLAPRDIGRALGCATGTAGVRLHRARNRFRRALLDQQEGHRPTSALTDATEEALS